MLGGGQCGIKHPAETMGRDVLSVVWMGLLAWFGHKGLFPWDRFIYARSFTGIMWWYLCTSKALLSKIPNELIIN